MPFIADGRPSTRRADDPSLTRSVARDPAKVAVHAALAIYLAPVVLLVCLVGAIPVVAGRATSVARKLGRRITKRGDPRPDPTPARGLDGHGPRPGVRRPSHSSR